MAALTIGNHAFYIRGDLTDEELQRAMTAAAVIIDRSPPPLVQGYVLIDEMESGWHWQTEPGQWVATTKLDAAMRGVFDSLQAPEETYDDAAANQAGQPEPHRGMGRRAIAGDGQERITRTVMMLAGISLLALAVALAWGKPDGVIVAAMLAAGVVLSVMAMHPNAPSKVSFGPGGASAEWPQVLVDREYAATLEAEIHSVLAEEGRIEMERWAAQHPGEPPAVGGGSWAFEADLESSRELAATAGTPQDVLHAVDVARQAARERGHALRAALQSSRPR